MNRKAGRNPGFVQSVTAAVASCYGDVLQDLVTYQRRAPSLSPRTEPGAEPEESNKAIPDDDETPSTNVSGTTPSTPPTLTHTPAGNGHTDDASGTATERADVTSL